MVYSKYNNLRYEEFIDLSTEELISTHQDLVGLTQGMGDFVELYNKLVFSNSVFESDSTEDIFDARVLQVVSNEPGITASEIRKIWNKSPAFMSRTLRKLEDQGLITREIDDDNRIYLKIYTTQKGDQVVKDLYSFEIKVMSTILRSINEKYSEEELEEFVEFCTSINNSVKKIYETAYCK